MIAAFHLDPPPPPLFPSIFWLICEVLGEIHVKGMTSFQVLTLLKDQPKSSHLVKQHNYLVPAECILIRNFCKVCAS